MITLTGQAEIDKVLRGLPAQLNHKVLQTAYARSAKPLVNTEKLLAPKREGDLRESIGIKRTTLKRANAVGEIKIGPLYRKGGRVGHLIEYGTKQRKLKGKGQYRAGTNRGAITAKPFAEPAWLRTRDTVRGQIKVEIGKSLISYMRRTVKKFG